MERVVIESKRELLVETLNKQVAEYKKKTGVDLAGKSVKEIYSKATTEYNKLYEEINAEYETQRKVVDCIESGDIDGAKRLLGMDVEAEAEEETESVEEAVEELEVGDDFELKVEDSEESEDLEDYEEETLEEENSEEEDEDETAEVEDGFADLKIEEIDLDDLSVEPEEVEEESKKVKKTKKGMDNPFDKTDDIFDFVEKAEEKAGAKKVDEKKTEEKKAEKKAKAEPKKVEDGVESLADFFEDDDEILDFADGIDGLSLDFN